MRVACCFKAGYDGFWLHRWLCAHAVESHVQDAASVLVDRRARRAKTDRLDAAGLLRTLMALECGERQVCRVVHVPAPPALPRAGALGGRARPAPYALVPSAMGADTAGDVRSDWQAFATMKGRVCHRWFTRGQRPPGLCDQRYTWAHLFAAVQPAMGQGFALVRPEVSTTAMQAVPDNVPLVLLPPYSPELNPVERAWLFLRERHLSPQLLAGYGAIVGAFCSAWNQLTPERLNTLTNCPYLCQIRI